MFARIVVPIDLSNKHERTLEIVRDLASQNDAEVTLLHVVELIPGITHEDEPQFYDRLEARAKDHLGGLARALAERGVRADVEVLFGSRADVISRRALDLGADLIVLSSHRIKLEDPSRGWGTLSYKVSILAQCPVLLVK